MCAETWPKSRTVTLCGSNEEAWSRCPSKAPRLRFQEVLTPKLRPCSDRQGGRPLFPKVNIAGPFVRVARAALRGSALANSSPISCPVRFALVNRKATTFASSMARRSLGRRRIAPSLERTMSCFFPTAPSQSSSGVFGTERSSWITTSARTSVRATGRWKTRRFRLLALRVRSE